MPSFTKLYLTDLAAPYTPATIRGAWDTTTGSVTRALDPSKVQGGTPGEKQVSEAVTTNPYHGLIYRGVSVGLPAQTISGNFDVCILAAENTGGSLFSFHLHVYVTQGDSDTPRGTLITDFFESSGVKQFNSGGAGMGTVLSSAQAISSLAISAGDRIVVEVGYVTYNTTSASRTCEIHCGTAIGTQAADDAADGVLGSAQTLGDGASFISFSSAISTSDSTERVTAAAIEVFWVPSTANPLGKQGLSGGRGIGARAYGPSLIVNHDTITMFGAG